MGIATIKCFENQCTEEDSVDAAEVDLLCWFSNLDFSGWVITEDQEIELRRAAGTYGPDQEVFGQCPEHAQKAGD